MGFVTRTSLCLILGTLCSACGVQAQSQPSQAEAKAFVSQYVAAFNAKDAARWEALFTAETRACITSENKDYYDTTRAMTWRDPIPANYTFTVSAVNEGNLKAIETFGRFPLKPERELHIDYQQGDDLGSVVVYMVHEKGRWMADQPCATEQTLKQYHADAAANAKLTAQYKALAAAIQEPLRSQLLKLLHEHE